MGLVETLVVLFVFMGGLAGLVYVAIRGGVD